MKKLLILALVILPLTASAVWYNPLTWFQKSSPELSVGGPAAGTVNYTPTLVPLDDSLWDIGTSTKAYRQFWIDEICFTGDTCETAWPAGGGGAEGVISTSTALVNTNVVYSTGVASIGNDSGMTYSAAGDRLTVVNASTTNLSTSYASSTIANLGTLFTGLSNGFAYIGSGGQLNSLASSSILLQDLGGAVTDAQVPDSITVTLAGTATALAANGANCSAGSFPLGVDASGAVETCAAVSISGITNGNNLADLTATNASLTFSGAYNGGTARTVGLNVGNANTWTAKQDFFGSASSTLFSSNWLKVGGTASTTIDTAGNVSLPAAGTLTIPALTSALTLTGAGGELAEYAGTSCTNQFVRSLSALGVATCATVGSADVSLANLTATDSTLTFSGTYTGATARTIGLNLGNANTWTVNQTFNYSSSTAYSSFLTASSTFANVGTLSMPSLANSFPYFNSSGTAVATTSPVFYERMFSNWASTTPNFNSQIYASGATSTLKIYLPRAVSFTAIGGSIRTGTSLLCEIGNGTASSTRVLTTTAGQTSDSVTLAGEVTVACGSGSGNPDDANFTVLGTFSI